MNKKEFLEFKRYYDLMLAGDARVVFKDVIRRLELCIRREWYILEFDPKRRVDSLYTADPTDLNQSQDIYLFETQAMHSLASEFGVLSGYERIRNDNNERWKFNFKLKNKESFYKIYKYLMRNQLVSPYKALHYEYPNLSLVHSGRPISKTTEGGPSDNLFNLLINKNYKEVRLRDIFPKVTKSQSMIKVLNNSGLDSNVVKLLFFTSTDRCAFLKKVDLEKLCHAIDNSSKRNFIGKKDLNKGGFWSVLKKINPLKRPSKEITSFAYWPKDSL